MITLVLFLEHSVEKSLAIIIFHIVTKLRCLNTVFMRSFVSMLKQGNELLIVLSCIGFKIAI